LGSATPPVRLDARQLAEAGLINTLGIAFPELTPARVVATMEVTPRHHQPLGYLHGGASLALAESVASVGAFLNCPPGMIAFGQEINANHVRPVRGGALTAIGTPLHLGRTTQIWDIKIYNQDQQLVCVSRCTVAVVPERPQHEP
jgi:1,4-dihydroxy-2-naphthoyl-CoA hydrolase